MTILDYHKLHLEEERSWNRQDLDAAARRGNPALPDQVQRLLPDPDEKFGDSLEDLKPSPLHDKLARLCELYLSATPDERAFIRASLDRQQGNRLHGFGVRAAVLGLRERSERMLRLGLAAHAIDNLKSGDARDTLCSVTLLFHAAKEIGLDPAALFCEAAAISGPGLAALLVDFARRDPSMQGLFVMGWRQIDTPHGVSFQQIPWAPPRQKSPVRKPS